MDKKISEDFMRSCLLLAKELLDKDSLSKAEEDFLKKMDLVIDNMKQV